MATFNKFQIFASDLATGNHNLQSDDIRIYLTNDVPDAAADEVKADLAELATGNGYTSGGVSITQSFNNVSGTVTITGSDVTWTASGGTIGPFRYVVLFNATPVDGPLIGWWDYGSSITLQDTETFTVDFQAEIMTIA